MKQNLKLLDGGFAGATCHQLLKHIYVEWLNNYLTVEVFAEHHDMTVDDAQALIDLGRNALSYNDELQTKES